MRLLWVKAGKILPVDTGGKIRSYNLARQLASRHELTFLSYYDGAPDESYEREVARVFPGSVTLRTGAPTSGFVAQGAHYLRRFPSSAPYAVSKFTVPEVAGFVTRGMREQRYDAMICDFLSASLNFPRSLTTPSVLFQHNVESALWDRQARHEANPLKRLVFELEAKKMVRYERHAVRRFHHVIAVSEHDRSLMSEMTDPTRISVVPTGVDLSLYRAARGAPPEKPLVLFLGSMDWEANIDGVDWFCRDIWPTVLATVPDAKFRIVGRNPHARVRKLESASVEVTGTVPSVIEHLQEAAVFVVPLRIGGGTRLKIFEAMATGRACVSTSVGAEGLDVTHGTNILLEDEAEGFAKSVIRLLRDRAERARFAHAAGDLAARYDWSVIVATFEASLEQARSTAA